jgi:hypothetical protein
MCSPTGELSPVLSLCGTFWLEGLIVRTFTLMLRFEEIRYSRRCKVGLLTFFHRTNYVKFEPVNNTTINFNKYCECDWYGFCGEVGLNMFRDRLKSVLSGEGFGHQLLKIIYHDV